MRTLPTWLTTLTLLAVLARSGATQQVPNRSADGILRPRLTPLSVNEPRALPAQLPADARPLSAYSPIENHDRRQFRPPVDVRLVSSEAPAVEGGEQPGLRLLPRRSAARQPLAGPAASSPTAAVGTAAGSLSIVLGVFLAIVWWTRRLAPGASSALPREVVEVLGRAPLAGRLQMQLLRIGNKLLLLAVSPAGAEPLTEITDPVQVEQLLAHLKRGQAGSATAAFHEALQQLGSQPAPRSFVAAGPTTRGAR